MIRNDKKYSTGDYFNVPCSKKYKCSVKKILVQSRPITHEEPQSKQSKYTLSAIVNNNKDTQDVLLSVTLTKMPWQYQDTKNKNEDTQREYIHK